MLNAAIVGLGWWGKQIVTCLAESEKIDIVRAVDVNLDAARDFAASHGLDLGSSYEDVLTDPSIDAVILVTPHLLHEEQVLAAAAAGKQIFCEKPFALNADAAKRMLAACGEKDIVVGIGHERRFEPALEAMKTHLDAGDFGTLIHIECNWSHNNFTKAVASGWRRDSKQAPAGTLTALGVHITDYFQSLAGPVARLRAQSAHRSDLFPADDVVSVQFAFESGATGFMCNIATTPFYSRVNVFGDKGWGEARENSNVDIAEPATLTTRWLNEELTTQTFASSNVVKANLEQWADAAEGRGDYRFTPDQKLHNVEILEAIVRSVESG
ncbi:MAG: Gfo/Idh/MocA family oxidoreductase, partial [Alphaproteobacteria bacterium]|nr:Gfo/Idh/MocA family oxidoreductase [Alphaproteobacteria bacterium]